MNREVRLSERLWRFGRRAFITRYAAWNYRLVTHTASAHHLRENHTEPNDVRWKIGRSVAPPLFPQVGLGF
jgi:hypothetical protein